MSSLIKQGWTGKINLIYIDPPFFTGADFTIRIKPGNEQIEKEPSIIEERAYKDTWSGGIVSYLKYMYERLILMRELLAENGSIYVHLDWHVGHYVNVMMDEIFGYKNFRNELPWKYFGPTSTSDNFPRKHDSILFYAKNAGIHFFNADATLTEYDEKAIRRYDNIDEIGDIKRTDIIVHLKGIEKAGLSNAARKVKIIRRGIFYFIQTKGSILIYLFFSHSHAVFIMNSRSLYRGCQLSFFLILLQSAIN